MKRREFVIKTSRASVVLLTGISSLKTWAKKCPQPWGDANAQSDTMAKTQHYHLDVKDYIKDKKADKAKVQEAKKGATCKNCSIYNIMPGVICDEGQALEKSSCAIFPNKYVNAKGMCNTWAQKV